jgi:hypothetical protein
VANPAETANNQTLVATTIKNSGLLITSPFAWNSCNQTICVLNSPTAENRKAEIHNSIYPIQDDSLHQIARFQYLEISPDEVSMQVAATSAENSICIANLCNKHPSLSGV